MSFIFPSNEILKCYGVTALWRQSYLRGKKQLFLQKNSLLMLHFCYLCVLVGESTKKMIW